MATETMTALYSDIFLDEEADFKYSREKVTVLSGQNLAAGTVVGKILTTTATSAAKSGGNTGNGTNTMDVTTPVKAGAKVGVYTIRFVIAAANNGTFVVTDPDGFEIGTVVMAAGAGAFDNDIKFAIADGSTDFVVGDGFDVTVTVGSLKVKILAPAANDGTQIAAGVMAFACDASSADKEGVMVARHAIVKSTGLVWPGGITDGQKTTALSQLAASGIIQRTGIGTEAANVVS
jgi:hypothetical protein